MLPDVVQNLDGTWRVKNVPIVSTGIEYPLSNGPTTFTAEQLSDAVSAMKEDPAVVEPRIKLGHTSGYNEALIGDAEQAFGRLDAETVYLGDNGQTIYGDYTGVPEWLGSVMSIAYPNRSIEGNFDVDTVTGKNYKLVITAVSLLGIYWPGCSVLKDLPTWYGETVPDGVEFSTPMAVKIAAGGGTELPGVKAAVDISQIRRKFYGEVAVDDKYWWWIRGEQYDDTNGLQLIVDDDEGELFRVSTNVDGQEVSFGDPVNVYVDYPEKTAAARAAVVAGMAVVSGKEKLVIHASRADTTDRPDKSTQEGASARMDDAQRKKLAASLGLPEDATEGDINAKLQDNALAAEAVDESGSNPPEGEKGEKPKVYPPVGTGPGDPAKEGLDEDPDAQHPAGTDDPDAEAGIVKVDKKVWEDTLAGAALARKHEDERKTERIDAVIKAAKSEGKFKPADEQQYRNLLASNFDQGKAIIDTLQAGIVPTEERGSAGGGGNEGVTAGSAGEGLPSEWFPEIVDIRNRVAARAPVTQAKEG